MVETFDGTIASKRDCRFIKGEFYLKNKQCFLIDDVWYRVNSGFIVFDHEKGSWVVVKSNPQLVKGVIGYDDNKKEIILGMFSPNPYKNVSISLKNGMSFNCINVDVLPIGVFKEDPRNMNFVPIEQKITKGVPANTFGNHNYPFTLQYCVKHYDSTSMDMFNNILKRNVNYTKSNIASYASCIGDYSFGLEFETCRGKIPNYRLLDTGLVPLRDGSIAGIEFATIPLSGKKGVAILEEACENLSKYTTFSEQESLHLHIGNTMSTKRYIGYLYTVCCILEKEIYSMFPRYYAQTSKFKARGRDYNMPLKREYVGMTAEETFDNIAFYLSSGKKYQGFGAAHPSDPEGQHKWGIQER